MEDELEGLLGSMNRDVTASKKSAGISQMQDIHSGFQR
jgi:hypothetical protein